MMTTACNMLDNKLRDKLFEQFIRCVNCLNNSPTARLTLESQLFDLKTNDVFPEIRKMNFRGLFLKYFGSNRVKRFLNMEKNM